MHCFFVLYLQLLSPSFLFQERTCGPCVPMGLHCALNFLVRARPESFFQTYSEPSWDPQLERSATSVGLPDHKSAPDYLKMTRRSMFAEAPDFSNIFGESPFHFSDLGDETSFWSQ